MHYKRAVPKGAWTANAHIDLKAGTGPNTAMENAAAASAALYDVTEEEDDD